MTSSALPRSVAHWSDPFFSLVVTVCAYVALYNSALDNTQLACALVGSVTALMIATELLRAPWRCVPRPHAPLAQIAGTAAVKWVGLMCGLALVLVAWWLLKEYKRAHYRPLFDVVDVAIWWVPLLVAAWVFVTEWRLGPEPAGEHRHGWDLGLLVINLFRRKRAAVDWREIGDDLLAWMVKGFFLPLNFCILVKYLGFFRGHEEAVLSLPVAHAHMAVMWILYALLITALTPGYMFSSRLLNTHIRKVDRTAFGWMVTMLCYSPFRATAHWFSFYALTRPEGLAPYVVPWVWHFQNVDALFYACAVVIIALEAVHWWGEATFGIRSSNLTNRGVITVGPYRFCKHPVYLAKCVNWCIIAVPFLMGDTALESLRLTLAWCAVCILYSMRAWVEERLLSSDPDYVAYALWMDGHGAFAWVGRTVPFMSYGWRLERWRKNV